MDKYESNSFKARAEKAAAEERPKLEKVVNGTGKLKKKSGVSKFLRHFVSDDVTNIREYVFSDVIVPFVKETISKTVDVFLFGNTKRSRTTGTKISYRSFYDEPRGRYREEPSRQPAGYDDVTVDTRGEAEAVLEQLEDVIQTYGWARVSDLYDLVGISCPYTNNNYGWTNISSARIQRVRDGFLIEMPKASPIK